MPKKRNAEKAKFLSLHSSSGTSPTVLLYAKKHRANDTSYIPVDDLDAMTTFSKIQGIQYLFAPKPNRDIEKALYIAPVAILGHEKKNFGVFTTETIQKDIYLGAYLGDTQTNQQIEAAATDSSYLFAIEGNNEQTGKIIDARTKRNWTGFVNGAASNHAANVYAEEQSNGSIGYFALRDIDAGEQLLLNYGEDYKFNVAFRFLKSSDNDHDSYDIRAAFPACYAHDRQSFLSRTLLRYFKFQTQPRFCVPTFENLTEQTVDFPFLAYKPNTAVLLKQAEQENITSLMYACWKGELSNVQALLAMKANPNIQSSIQGYTAFQLVIASPTMTVALKKECINLLLRYGTSLNLQDRENDSVLHHAVRYGEADLVLFLLNKNKEIVKKNASNHEPSLVDLVNDDELDAFLLAVSLGQSNIVSALIPYLSQKDINHYLKEKLLDKVLTTLNHATCAVKAKKLTREAVEKSPFYPSNKPLRTLLDTIKLDITDRSLVPPAVVPAAFVPAAFVPAAVPDQNTSHMSLMEACNAGDLQSITTLFREGHSPNTRHPLHDEYTALHFMTAANVPLHIKKQGITLLYQYGENLFLKNKQNETCLHLAIHLGDTDLVQFLLTKTTSPLHLISIKNIYSHDALQLAIFFGHHGIVANLVVHTTRYYFQDERTINALSQTLEELIKSTTHTKEKKQRVLNALSLNRCAHPCFQKTLTHAQSLLFLTHNNEYDSFLTSIALGRWEILELRLPTFSRQSVQHYTKNNMLNSALTALTQYSPCTEKEKLFMLEQLANRFIALKSIEASRLVEHAKNTLLNNNANTTHSKTSLSTSPHSIYAFSPIQPLTGAFTQPAPAA